MAGNKINTKKKDDKSKSGRSTDPAMDESEDIDFSLLRKPILTSITGFAQARKIFDMATEELKGLLSTECDILYECKVCRNIFRSLANFISHKRVYCKEKFSFSVHSHFVKETSVMNEVLKIKKLEESYQESLTEKVKTCEDVDDSRIPITKDLTSIIEKITKNRGLQQSEVDNKQMVFQKIAKSSVAVFQNLEDDTKSDTMKAQVDELNNILSQENAVLQSDGSFKVQSSDKIIQKDDKDTQSADNVIQISDDDENEDSDILKCKICDLQFSTLKTLKFHMKYKHLENRLVYPCPDCLDIFSTSWSVYRHLFKVHRKTAAQIRRLRESIQAKAFRMNNPPAFYEKRKTLPKTVPTQKITEEERLFKENQAWLEELDGESEGRRCGGCGRTFERRAALAAHTHTCARRHRRRIQIQIRKDYHKEPNNPYMTLAGAAHTPADVNSSVEDSQTVDKEQEDKDTKEEKEDIDEEPPEAEPPTLEVKNQEPEGMEMDEPGIQNKPKFNDSSLINKIPFAQQIEKNNLNAFKQKIASDVDLFKLLCKKCDIKHGKMEDFFDHMSSHYKWVRYACKLCNFKHFNFDKLPEHVKIVHKLKGNTEFYHSTVKAVDSAEALELSESVEEQNEANETSPDSRRPSRCSSDSSRMSDDSSSSSTKPETGSRKRKSNVYKTNAKKKRGTEHNDHIDDILILEDTAPNKIIMEENSSDFDEVQEKNFKRQNIAIVPTVASRRPVRKKTKPKNSDFEYDLSNLLKMEAQGYRDSQVVCNKTSVSKKKTQEVQNSYDVVNKDCCGAMITLSRKSVESAQGHMKIASFPVFKTSKESRISSIFARPMVPRITKEKNSPKKVESEELNSISSPSKVAEPSSSFESSINKVLIHNSSTTSQPEAEGSEISTQITASIIKNPTDSLKTKPVGTGFNEFNKNVDDKFTESVLSSDKDKSLTSETDKVVTKPVSETEKVVQSAPLSESNSVQTTVNHNTTPDTSDNNTKPETNQTKPNLNMVPIKFRRQSLDVMKNPIIKKNITDFTKAGMKTKILVIKPINRKADGTHNLNAPLKFQTIKLKDARKSSIINEEKKSKSVVVVQVPKVDCGITRPLPTNNVANNGISPEIPNSLVNINKEQSEKDGLSVGQTSNEDEVALNCDNNIDNKMLEKNSKENNAQNDQTKSESDEVASGCENRLNADEKMSDKILEMDHEKIFDQTDQASLEHLSSENGKTHNYDKSLNDANLEKSCVETDSGPDQVIDETVDVSTELMALDSHKS